MGRYRSRSRSYSPRRSRSYSSRRSRSPLRSKRYDDPRDRYRGSGMSYRDRRFSGPSGLLVRNISLDARPEDLRKPFERFGPVKDVYLPKNYYTGEPRGFGFVKFHNPEDAAEAKEHMNHQVIGGREIRIAFAEENRKTPQEMRKSVRISDRSDRYRRRSSPRSPRHRYRSYSRSPTPVRRSSRSGGHSSRYDDYYSPRRSISRSPSPKRGRSISRSPSRSLSPRGRKSISRSPSRSLSPRGRKSISRSPSPRISRSVSPRGKKSISRSVTPPGKRSISRSLSPRRSISRSPALRRSFSRSPAPRRSISRPPSHDNGYRSSRRLPSPRDNGRSPSRSRSYSPRR